MLARSLATISLGAILSTAAAAADAIELRAVTKVAQGAGHPHVVFVSRVDGRLTAAVSCSGRRFSLSDSIAPGGEYTLSFEGLRAGSHACNGSVTLTTADGAEGSMPLNFQVAVLVPPTLKIDPADLDLDQRTVVLQSDRPLEDVQIAVFGVGGANIGGGRQPGGGQTRVPLSWTSEGEIVRIDLNATDVDGASSVLTLLPWSYAIPHEDVIFASNEASIPAGEIPKLEAAWHEVEQTLAKYGSIVDIELFVAGYTDTVGPADHNDALSQRRARAIAQWFRQRGFSGPIHYQGFGESALAVPTADGVDQAANRRAMYVLAARPPAVSTDLPRSHWTPLR